MTHLTPSVRRAKQPGLAGDDRVGVVERVVEALPRLGFAARFEDSLQAALLGLLVAPQGVVTPDPVGWVWRAVRNAQADENRREQLDGAYQRSVACLRRVQHRVPTPVDTLIGFEAAFGVATAIAGLEPRERWLYLRREWQGRSLTAIALEQAGLSTVAARNRLSAALSAIRRKVAAAIEARYGVDARAVAAQADPIRFGSFLALIAHADGLD